MSQPVLLVSVRDATEAGVALAGGAAIIDVKEPAAGSLGMASAATIAACGKVVPAGIPWTLAGGELDEAEAAVDRLRLTLSELSQPPVAVKFGLSGWHGRNWCCAFLAQQARLPEQVRAIPVAYADALAAHAPSVTTVIDEAAGNGLPVVLIDTFDKSQSGSLLEEASSPEITGWVARGKAAGVSLVLAGRIAAEEIGTVAGCQPVAVAVRSAVCIGGRLGRIDEACVRNAVIACQATGSAGDVADIRKILQKGVSI